MVAGGVFDGSTRCARTLHTHPVECLKVPGWAPDTPPVDCKAIDASHFTSIGPNTRSIADAQATVKAVIESEPIA